MAGILVNSVTVLGSSGEVLLNAGETVSDPSVIAAAQAAGGMFVSSTDPTALAAVAVINKMRSHGANAEALTNVMQTMVLTGAPASIGASVGNRVHATVPTLQALAALPKSECVDGMHILVQDGTQGSGSMWVFSSASTATDTSSQLVVTPTSAPGGSFLRTDKQVDLKLAIGFGSTDAQVLFTVPTGFKLFLKRAFWEVTTGWTGGTSSAIGLSSSNAAYSTKGDLLGGASGDLAATLITTTPGPYVGTAGAKTAGASPVVLVAGNTIRFDRIASAFTAGAGFAHIPCDLVA